MLNVFNPLFNYNTIVLRIDNSFHCVYVHTTVLKIAGVTAINNKTETELMRIKKSENRVCDSSCDASFTFRAKYASVAFYRNSLARDNAGIR